MTRYRKIGAGVLLFLLVLLAGLGGLRWRSHLKREQIRRAFANPPLELRFPPKDYSQWLAECGANEPDPSTPEGQARLRDEARRLPAAEEEFERLLRSLPTVYTNDNDQATKDLLSQVNCILNGFCRENCERLLKRIEKLESWGGGKFRFRMVMSESQRCRSIDRHCKIYGQFADWLWIRCGNEYQAAEADRAILNFLNGQLWDGDVHHWNEVKKTANRWLEYYKRERCDSEKSNFCRAHKWGEKHYDTCWAEYVRKDPRTAKLTEQWHGVFLKSARYYLKREPKWSPNYKADADEAARP